MPDYQVERMRILEMIEAGEISAKDGLALLEALTGDATEPGISEPVSSESHEDPISDAAWGEEQPEGEVLEAEILETPPATEQTTIPGLDADAWRGWWKYVFWTGTGILLIGTLILLLALQFSAAWFWFLCAGVPLIVGFLIVLLGIYSRRSRWIHIRIRQQEGEFPSKIALSFPLLIRPAVWFIRVFGRWIPNFDNTGVDEVLLALGESASPENPLYLQVQDDEDGEQVEIYIG